ncbi:MAG: DUF4258 domain-containing protein [Chloroflexota bacterium]
MNFPDRYISWEGGHALKRCEERNKEPSEVESVIRNSGIVEKRRDGRYNVDGCIGGEVTRVIVAEIRTDAVVVVTVFGRGVPCS